MKNNMSMKIDGLTNARNGLGIELVVRCFLVQVNRFHRFTGRSGAGDYGAGRVHVIQPDRWGITSPDLVMTPIWPPGTSTIRESPKDAAAILQASI